MSEEVSEWNEWWVKWVVSVCKVNELSSELEGVSEWGEWWMREMSGEWN